jgi:hypothetical protein
MVHQLPSLLSAKQGVFSEDDCLPAACGMEVICTTPTMLNTGTGPKSSGPLMRHGHRPGTGPKWLAALSMPPMPLLAALEPIQAAGVCPIRQARQGAGFVTDPFRQSGGGKGKGRLPESVERIIRELLQKALP